MLRTVYIEYRKCIVCCSFAILWYGIHTSVTTDNCNKQRHFYLNVLYIMN